MFELFRKFSVQKFILPASINEIGNYRENFERAKKFTSGCGYEIGQFNWKQGEIRQDDMEGALNKAKISDLNSSAGQCLKWCHYLAPHFQDYLNRRVELTIGQLWIGDKTVFNPTWEEFKRWSVSGLQIDDFTGNNRSGANLHAWLTVDTGEIIEPTLLSTLALVKDNYKKFQGGMIYGVETEMFGHRYFPMAVGTDIAEAISDRSLASLLAKHKEELYSVVSGAIVL